jgi:hypothetical protein
MKKIFTLTLLLAIAFVANAQTKKYLSLETHTQLIKDISPIIMHHSTPMLTTMLRM